MVTTVTATNSTEEQRNIIPLGIAVLIVFLSLCGLAGNGTISWFLGFSMRKNPYSVYIFNLAITDFLFLFCMALSSILNRPESGHWPPYVFEILRRIRFFFYTLGLSLLAAISIQRCISVLFPIWYRCHRPKHLSTLVCAGLWVLAILENLVAIYFCVVQNQDMNSCKKVDIFFAVLILGVFTPVMCISGLALFIKVQRVSRRRQPARLYITVLVTILVFLICALPLALYWFVLSWVIQDKRLCGPIYDVTKIFSCVNSTANPIIYYLVGRQRKRRLHEPLRVVLERALGNEEMSPEETVELGSESRGVQGRSEDTIEEIPRINAKYRHPKLSDSPSLCPGTPSHGPPSMCPKSLSEAGQKY
ncbi:mas-related G-protein coupled receptor member D-like [Monodelphis domestica]|uniref:mas-related G-protein coupled receptor member D-like n=1 Tax=Monodelphis domestica TaxID=13616 RepID=UPI0024E1CB23|nr:mas-related G-protein coupled receptor member D-like [Monodelphis domestica]